MPSYLLSHGYASWGNDDVSTTDAFIQSIEKVIRAVKHKKQKQKKTHVLQRSIYRHKNIWHEVLLVSHDAQIDGGVAMLLNSCQQGGAITVPDLSRMKVIFWVQQLKKPQLNIIRHGYCIILKLDTYDYI